MEALVRSGGVADVIMACLVIEAVALVAWRRATGRGPAPRAVAALLLPGAFLVLALRFALTGGDTWLIAAALVGALVAHGWDLAGRLRGAAAELPR
ncbi:hypothetical protein [Roseomonas sp. CECT 9278]|uniref:hypothetical protein n=1 Tax=Roseomonas sp. CECT 9278 TaxID=2845823 RepID=UPI001E60D542|nr:hypothetical protein [Roseomonas sp. CECT 9278]CAH0241814.1 hypothetical protein ROS9278_02912 [Roseomonas sp. CECT 9278]